MAATNPSKENHQAFWGQGISGVHNITLSGQAATVTLDPNASGATYLFDSAAGIVYTLPNPSIGLKYRFLVTVSVTSNSAKVITSSSSVFLIGSIEMNDGGTVTAYSGDGSTNVSVKQNGTTTGGLQGSWLDVECVSSTLWQVSGTLIASGSVATPFATS